MTERGVAVARRVEVVPVQQDRHYEQDPVKEPEAGDRAERIGRRTALPEMARAGGQAAAHCRKLFGYPASASPRWITLRAEQVAPHSRGGQPGEQVTGAADKQGRGRANVAAPGRQMDAEAGDAADETDDRAGGGGDRVRHHELVLRDDVRQPGGQRGEEEPIDPEHRESANVEREPEVARGNEECGENDEYRPDQRGPHQDLAPGPAIDEDPRERADQRVRQVKDGECLRRGGRVRETLRGEERVSGETRVEHAVTGLRDQPGRE